MRTWGRLTDPLTGAKTWVEVATDAAGFDDLVWLTTLLQGLKLQLGESPFYADVGIPAKQAVLQQVPPDYNVARMQQRYAPRFANLIVAREEAAVPTYRVIVLTHQGVRLAASVAA